MESINEKFNQLPPNLQIEVLDFVDYLLSKKTYFKKATRPKLTWVGGLKEYSQKYTSTELQKLASEWRD